MSRDNKDRYGWRHREDEAYGLGESKPGTVGDSDGTIHDRASSDNNVIIDGKAQNYETHKREKQSENEPTSQDSAQKSESGNNHRQKSEVKSDQFRELDGEVIEVEIDRISGSGNPLAIHRGIHIHVPDGEPGKSYEVELNAQSGYFVGKIRLNE